MKWPIEVYVCPECGNYFGSSSVSRVSMEKEMTDIHVAPVGHSRLRCPDCWVIRGRDVNRVWCALEIELVPVEKTTP